VELGPFDRHARGLRRDASRAPAAAVDFALDVPVRALRATDVVVGEDFRFGHRGPAPRVLGRFHRSTGVVRVEPRSSEVSRAQGVVPGEGPYRVLLDGVRDGVARVDAAGRLFVEPGRASGTVTVDYLERL
jgi:FAD synthase